jgi:hypothetical protein
VNLAPCRPATSGGGLQSPSPITATWQASILQVPSAGPAIRVCFRNEFIQSVPSTPCGLAEQRKHVEDSFMQAIGYQNDSVESYRERLRKMSDKELIATGKAARYMCSREANPATTSGDYSKWIPERQAALETAIRSTWEPISSADARQTRKMTSK